MRQLILFRHAKAEARSASGEDFDRALTERGLSDGRLMGRVLSEAGIRPDLALVSPAARTRQTWAAAAPAFAPPIETQYPKNLYNAGLDGLRRLVEELESHEGAVVIVGHNPGLHQLTLSLLVEGAAAPSIVNRAAGRFPTASAAVFAFDAAARPVYDGLYFCAEHGGGAGD